MRNVITTTLSNAPPVRIAMSLRRVHYPSVAPAFYSSRCRRHVTMTCSPIFSAHVANAWPVWATSCSSFNAVSMLPRCGTTRCGLFVAPITDVWAVCHSMRLKQCGHLFSTARGPSCRRPRCHGALTECGARPNALPLHSTPTQLNCRCNMS